MSREYNYGGTSLIVDSIEELFENGAVQTKTVSNIKQVIGLQRQSKDINKLKEQIKFATDDGVITVSEKPGLNREWASLGSSYATISDKFTQDDTLKENSLFYVLKARFNELSPIMDEIFADMNSSYKNAEKVSKLTDLFVESWKYITLCSQLLETKLSISDRFSLQISPTREIVGPLDIRVTLLDLTNGIYSDVTNQSTYLDSDFVWKKTSDKNFERTGRVLSLTLDDMSSNEEQFTLTFKHKFTYEDPNATDVVIAKRISFTISTGTLSQWTWSDAATKEELLMDPLAIWLDYRREFNTKKYLWRRDTDDLLKADSEKEWLYFRESGLDGLIGSNGYSRAVLELFKRSETTPESFDGGVITYTFSTNAISGDTGTWQKTIPEGDYPLYIIKATAFANTETDSISTGEWTTPAILSEHGTDGATGATAFSLVLYQRSESSPSKPSDIVTYNIKTGAISGNGNWSLSFPSNNGYPCWAINATAFSYTYTDEITSSEWSDVQKLVENGKNGEDGKGLRIIADRTFLRYRENNTPYGDVANLTLQTNLDASKAAWSVDGVAILASDSIVIDSSYFVREWESASTSSTARMRCIYQADGYLLIGGVSGALVVSKDNGKTWATVSKFASNAITGISSKNGTFVAVDGDGKIYSTTDPEGTWNLVFESGKIFNAVVCDGSVFVAVGEGSGGIICKSSNGAEWETINGTFPNFYAICHDGKSFVAIGAGGTAWKSEDGTTWRVAGSTGFDCRGISFNSGKYIAGGASGQIAYSYNGDTWYRGTVTRTSTATVSHIRAITSAYGEYYSVCYLSNGYGEIWKSNNGIDWSVCYEPLAANTRIWAVAFIGTGILASGDNGKTYYLELPRSISVEVACEGLSDRTAIYIQQDAASGAQGDKGTDAIPPKYQWRLGSSSTEPPVDTINHLADGAVSTFDGTVLAETNTGWLDVRPTPTNDLPYIWERMSSDGGLTWSDPYCLSINTIKNIEVVSSHASFNLNSRGVCETLQTITCSIVRSNTIDPCFWTVTKDGNLTDIVATEGDSITFSVAVGETTKNIEVSAVCSGMARAVNIFSKIVGKIVPANLTHELKGHYNDTVYIPEVFSDGITPVMKGDYIIYYPTDSEGKEYPTPAVYNGSAWVPVKAETAPDNYSQIMSDTLPDVLASGITVPVVSAYYGYFENLAAQAAVITKLFSEFIKIGGAIYGGAYDEYGNNSTGGAGFYLGKDGRFKAIEATVVNAMITNANITGEIIGQHFNSVARSSVKATLSSTTPSTTYYNFATVENDLWKAIKSNYPAAVGEYINATGKYGGESFHDMTYYSGSGEFMLSKGITATLAVPYSKLNTIELYIDFSDVTKLVDSSGNVLFTSEQSKYRVARLADILPETTIILLQKTSYLATGTVTSGGVTIAASGADNNDYITISQKGGSFYFSKGDTVISFASSLASYVPYDTSLNLTYIENLRGISATNIYRGDSGSTIGTSSEPFSKVYATELHGKVYYS